MSRYTKGPWKCAVNGNIWYGVDSCDNRDKHYGAPRFAEANTHSICTTHGPASQANARLIAAAPDMVQLLMRAVSHDEEPDIPPSVVWYDEARTILARINGEEK